MENRNNRNLSTIQKIGPKIEELAIFLEKTVSELEKGDYPNGERLLGNATISGWMDKDVTWKSDKLDKFLRYWKVNPTWWETNEGDIILTSVDKASNNKESAMGELEVYRKIFEGKTEYIVIPRTVLEKTQLISIDELDKKNGQIDLLIKLLGIELSKVPGFQDDKKKT